MKTSSKLEMTQKLKTTSKRKLPKTEDDPKEGDNPKSFFPSLFHIWSLSFQCHPSLKIDMKCQMVDVMFFLNITIKKKLGAFLVEILP